MIVSLRIDEFGIGHLEMFAGVDVVQTREKIGTGWPFELSDILSLPSASLHNTWTLLEAYRPRD